MNAVAQPETEKWARLIRASWSRSAEAVIETGRLCIDAKNNLAHGEWMRMADDLLPFGLRTAQRLMDIARDPKLSNTSNLSFLPPHVSSLVELTKLDDDEFAERIKDGTINPDMEARELAQRRKLLRREQREQDLGEKQRALPEKKFGVIVADPEWNDEVWGTETGMDRHAANHYPTSTAEIIAGRDVASIAAKDCVLWLWVTNQHLAIGIDVMRAWGFEYKSNYCWGKDRISLGRWQRGKHELLLIGTRGAPPCPAPGTQWESLVLAPKSIHSAKPECFLEMIDEYFPTLPKIELNRRGPARDGWSAWGNESG